jgi:hypothetical protein
MAFENFNGARVETISDSEKKELLLEKEVSESNDFWYLINVIKRFNDWKNSNGDPIDKIKLVETINAVRIGERSAQFVTRRYGLRAKVEELLADENTGTEQSGEWQKQPEVNVSQDELARQYLEVYAAIDKGKREWARIEEARSRNEAESGHMPDFETDNDNYRKQMDEVLRDVDRHREVLKDLFEQLTDETKNAYLKV